MKPRLISCLPVLVAGLALLTINPSFARGGSDTGGGRGGFTGRGFSTPRASGALSGRGSGSSLDGGGVRSPGGLDRGPRAGDRTPSGPRTGGAEGGRRGPTDRPGWDGRTPRGRHDRDHGRWNGHGPGWWSRRPYWGYGFGGYFYDPFYSPFYSYGAFNDSYDVDRREDERNIEVKVKPDDAQVYVNGLLYSNNGKARFALASGPWTVEIRAPGYQTERVELNVEPGKRYRIERKLRRDEATGRNGKPLPLEELDPRER